MRRLALVAGTVLQLVASTSAGQTTFSSPPGLNLAIPDGSYNGSETSMACHSISVSSFGNVSEASVQIAATHTFVGDLTVKLFSPSSGGLPLALMSRPGINELGNSAPPGSGSPSNLSAAFPIRFAQSGLVDAEQIGASLSSAGVICRDDAVCTVNPNRGATSDAFENLTASFGSGIGTWKLCIGDGATGEVGSIESWSLTLTSAPAADPNAVRPRALVVIDSSASMHLSARFFDFGPSALFGNVVDGVATHGDGSDEQPGCDIDLSNGIWLGRPNDSRLFQVKQAMQQVLRARAFRHPSTSFYEDTSAPPVGTIDFALASWRKARGGTACAGTEGSQSTCAAGLRCWDDDLNAATNRICALRAADTYLECSPFTWDEANSTFTCFLASCPNNDGSPSSRDTCNYFRVADTAHGDTSPFGSVVQCPSISSDNQFMAYGVTTCSDGGEVLDAFPSGAASNFITARQWLDHNQPRAVSGYVGNELRAIGTSPIAAALRDMRTYLVSGLNGFPAAISTDCSAGCRSYDIILISDGTDSCEPIANAAAAAAQLLGPFTVATPGCSSTSVEASIRTHVIAFPGCPEGVTDCTLKTDLDQLAQSGGTGSAVIARNEAELQAALSNIADGLLTTATVSGAANVCSGETGGVATSQNATQWGFRTVSGGTVTAIQTASVPTYTIAASDFPGPGSYFLVSGTCAFGTVSNEIAVTIITPPDATISGPSQLPLHTSAGASVPNAGAGASYTWSVSGATFSGQGSPGITFSASSAGMATLNVTVQNVSGCVATDSHNVMINSAPTNFTDDPLVPGFTTVKAAHIVEVRAAVNRTRVSAGLAEATWAEAVSATTAVRAAHIVELRSALTPALIAVGITPTFTDSGLSSGSVIKAAHVQEIREYSR